jgi:hypothetical protein
VRNLYREHMRLASRRMDLTLWVRPKNRADIFPPFPSHSHMETALHPKLSLTKQASDNSLPSRAHLLD